MNGTYIWVCMSNISILLSLVAGVEFSYHIRITHYFAQKPVWDVGLSSNIKQTNSYFIGAVNGVRLQRCSGLDTGVELERFYSNSFKKYNKNNAYIV